MATSVERSVTASKSAPNQKAKPATVKVTFLLPASLELALRLAIIQLEIAGEPFCTQQAFLQETVREKLSALGKAKKADYSSLAANGMLPARVSTPVPDPNPVA